MKDDASIFTGRDCEIDAETCGIASADIILTVKSNDALSYTTIFYTELCNFHG